MGKDSKIPWTHCTFNPWMGCAKVSPGCANCYAEAENIRYGRHVWGPDAPRQRTSTAYWKQPLKWNAEAEKNGERKRVFCGSWCDVMESGTYLDTIRQDLYALIERTPALDWLLLTKRPENFGPLLPSEWRERARPNVWLMTTVENADYLPRTDYLKAVPATVHGLSLEPLLGPLPTLWNHLEGIGWVIVGSESGSKRRPFDEGWVRSIRDQCVSAGVPFLYKQKFDSGIKIELPALDGQVWAQFPEVSRG